MKRMLGGFIGGLALLTAAAGFGQQEAAFFRIVSPTNSRITALSSAGTLAWTNASTAGVTCLVQRATTLTGPGNWVDYVRHGVTNATMAARVHDPKPPAGMRLIPAGMNSGTDPDFGAYSLAVAAFYMDTTEVTKAKWDEVYGWAIAHGYGFDNAGSGKAASHPVQTVNWFDCVKWCNARSQKEGRTPCYTNASGTVYTTGTFAGGCDWAANGYRLPTDVEWEYAARGGLSGRRFPWGDGDTIQHARANYYSSTSYAYDTSPTRGYHPVYATGGNPYTSPYTSPAGAFPSNGYGLYDMAGNVWEWCWDSSGSGGGIGRGGCWYGGAGDARCGNGYRIPPEIADYGKGGFRAVCR